MRARASHARVDARRLTLCGAAPYPSPAGPLLYHWAEMGPAEFSIELSWEELRALIVAHGFAIELEEWLPPMTYAANARSMLKMEYECVHTVCRKAGVQHR